MAEKDRERLEIAWAGTHRDPKDFLIARNGDHLMTPFCCDLCIFRILRGTNPRPDKESDKFLLACIRRINLDAFWSRSTGTVKENARRAKEILRLSAAVNIPDPFDYGGPFPFFDFAGFGVAITIVMKSRQPGRNDASHTQYSTIRHLKGVYGNFVRASPSQSSVAISLGGTDGRYTRLNDDKCASIWFQKFMEGVRNRMGQVHKPNKAMEIDLFRNFMERTWSRYEVAPGLKDKDRWLTFYTYCLLSTVLSLRGPEGLLLSLDALINSWERGKGKFVVIPLFGKFKGESGDISHLIPCVEVTNSGLKIRETLSLLIRSKGAFGLCFGPAMCNHKGVLYKTFELDEMLIDVLEEIHQDDPHSFPPDILSREQLQQRYQCFRTFRRTSDSHALNCKIKKLDIQIVNRWSKVERAGGKLPSMEMQHHYAEFATLLEPFLRYTAVF